MNEFGNFLYSLRKDKGLTQKELANLLNITNKAVSKWETGEAMPETSLLLPLSKILGVTVDELLNCKKNNSQTNKDDNINNEDVNNSSCNNTNNNINFTKMQEHIFSRGKDDETLIEKIKGAVCACVFLLSLTTYFLIGIVLNLWSPYWVIIPISALCCGIIGIVFDFYNKKTQQKVKKGENVLIGSICGIVMLSCIIAYLILGSVFSLWHPYWFILVLGGVFCGITGTIGEVCKYKNNQNK